MVSYGAGDHDVREVLPAVRRRFFDQRLFRPRNGRDVALDHEVPKLRQLSARTFHCTPLRLIRSLLRHANGKAALGQVRFARLRQRREIAIEVGTAHGLELAERSRHAFGQAQHGGEFVRTQSIGVGGLGLLRLEPLA